MHGEAVGRVGARHHHVGIQADEDRDDAGRHRDRRGRERESVPALVDQPDGGEDGQDRQQLERPQKERAGGGHVGPDGEARDRGGGERRDPPGQAAGPVAHVAGGPQAQEGRPVQQADQHQGDPGEHRVGLKYLPERAGVVLAGVDRQPVQQVAQSDADHERGEQAAHGQRDVPGAAPVGRVALAPVLEGHAADDERYQQQDHRQVQAREHGRVPAGESGEHGGAGHDQPDLIAVPQRSDRVDDGPAADVVPADDAVQHADAEVEALEEEEAGPQHGDDDEPERDQVAHRDLSTGRPGPGRPPRPRRGAAGAPCASTSASAAGRRCRGCRRGRRRR